MTNNILKMTKIRLEFHCKSSTPSHISLLIKVEIIILKLFVILHTHLKEYADIVPFQTKASNLSSKHVLLTLYWSAFENKCSAALASYSTFNWPVCEEYTCPNSTELSDFGNCFRCRINRNSATIHWVLGCSIYILELRGFDSFDPVRYFVAYGSSEFNGKLNCSTNLSVIILTLP